MYVFLLHFFYNLYLILDFDLFIFPSSVETVTTLEDPTTLKQVSRLIHYRFGLYSENLGLTVRVCVWLRTIVLENHLFQLRFSK